MTKLTVPFQNFANAPKKPVQTEKLQFHKQKLDVQ